MKKKMTSDRLTFSILGYAIVFIFGMLCIIPFWIVIMASFTSESSLLREGYSLWVRNFSAASYSMIFENSNRVIWSYRNTIFATIIGTTGAVLMACMTGYVLARKDFPWRNKWSFFFFFTTLFNGGLVPLYLLNTRILGFKNSFYALFMMLMFSVWNMIIAKNYMKTVPYEITESAKVDGANDIVIFFRLIFPLCKPLIATIGLFSALAIWNDWYNSMLYITNEKMMSLQYFLHEMLSSIQALKLIASKNGTVDLQQSFPQESMKMAMTIVVTGPIIFLYPFVQKYFVKGLTIGAVKG